MVNIWRYAKKSKTKTANANLSKVLGLKLLRKKKVYKYNKLRGHKPKMELKLKIHII